MQHLPASPAADAHEPRALGVSERRRRILHHALRVGVIAAAVVGVGAGVSVYLAEHGTRRCEVEDTVDGGTGAPAVEETCVTRSWWPFTIQMRSEVWTVDGVPDGPRIEWHANGELWVQGEYADGLRTGRWVERWENGAPRFEGTYVGDVLEGEESWYYSDGSLEWTAKRVHGKREGVERWLWPNGTIRRTGTWLDGEKHGRFTSYGESGEVLFTNTYVKGTQVPVDDG